MAIFISTKELAMNAVYLLFLLCVIIGHFYFAYLQWMQWPTMCKRLTDLEGEQVSRSAFLGRSIASYNISIAVGLLLTFLLQPESRIGVQAVVLAFIVLTAMVGAAGTKGNSILFSRLMPAALALLLLLIITIL